MVVFQTMVVLVVVARSKLARALLYPEKFSFKLALEVWLEDKLKVA